ncbi:hypothetical protein [Nonomuraea angiospora]|nr:hypothetical protein [Nonomuraea angiospora]
MTSIVNGRPPPVRRKVWISGGRLNTGSCDALGSPTGVSRPGL